MAELVEKPADDLLPGEMPREVASAAAAYRLALEAESAAKAEKEANAAVVAEYMRAHPEQSELTGYGLRVTAGTGAPKEVKNFDKELARAKSPKTYARWIKWQEVYSFTTIEPGRTTVRITETRD
jgi:hypothetical protein